ncbi:MAG: EscU/YscU/HrcU family type III secretion system export apparatus switch protein [Christensenellales bacterium]
MNKREDKKAREAAALKYNAQSDDAPYILALGKGYAADKMVEAAHESGVHVVQDEKLSKVLQKLSVGDEIPETLYQVVAEILSFISRIDEKYGARFGIDKMR